MEEKLRSGAFRSVEELIHRALVSLPTQEGIGGVRDKSAHAKSLLRFFRESPFVGMEMKFERSKDPGRKINL